MLLETNNNTATIGDEFQDNIISLFHLPIFKSRKYQLKFGESPSKLGIECKCNSKVEVYGVWIEVAEKRRSENSSYIITDWIVNKNVNIIFCGNENLVYGFAKKTLLRIIELNINDLKEIKNKTSFGLNLKLELCDKYCFCKFHNSKNATDYNIDFITDVINIYKDKNIKKICNNI